MFGLISRIRAVPEGRARLAEILAGVGAMPGCRSYVVALDQTDPHALWITETWDSAAAHRASLELPAVQEAIAAGRPLIASIDQRIETEPVGPS